MQTNAYGECLVIETAREHLVIGREGGSEDDLAEAFRSLPGEMKKSSDHDYDEKGGYFVWLIRK